MKIPFVIIPESRIKRVLRHYLGWGEKLSRIFPFIEWELEQADFPYSARQWLAGAVHAFLFFFSIIFSVMFLMMLRFNLSFSQAFFLAILMGMGVGASVMIYVVFYPRFFVSKKIKDLERYLPIALHHMLIEVRSGVPLFNTMISVAKSKYGPLSAEFAKTVNEINTGKSEINALEMMARNNKSLHFRRIIWQIVNSMKSGADIGRTLKEIVNNVAEEQRIAIKKYGSELNPLALFYMLLVVVFPTLGIIFILILFSFLGTLFSIEFILVGILVAVVIFQVMFMGLIKTKRPVTI